MTRQRCTVHGKARRRLHPRLLTHGGRVRGNRGLLPPGRQRTSQSQEWRPPALSGERGRAASYRTGQGGSLAVSLSEMTLLHSARFCEEDALPEKRCTVRVNRQVSTELETRMISDESVQICLYNRHGLAWPGTREGGAQSARGCAAHRLRPPALVPGSDNMPTSCRSSSQERKPLQRGGEQWPSRHGGQSGVATRLSLGGGARSLPDCSQRRLGDKGPSGLKEGLARAASLACCCLDSACCRKSAPLYREPCSGERAAERGRYPGLAPWHYQHRKAGHSMQEAAREEDKHTRLLAQV